MPTRSAATCPPAVCGALHFGHTAAEPRGAARGRSPERPSAITSDLATAQLRGLALTLNMACEDLSCTPAQIPLWQVSAGRLHPCGLSGLYVYCWGRHDRGQLGPVLVCRNSVGRFASDFHTVSAGGDFTCGLTTAGSPACWGRNDLGQLGDGRWTDSNEPMGVAMGVRVADTAFRALSAGLSHACGMGAGGIAGLRPRCSTPDHAANGRRSLKFRWRNPPDSLAHKPRCARAIPRSVGVLV
jgi:hypothetical protein